MWPKTVSSFRIKSLKLTAIALLSAVALAPKAQASDYRYGFSVGYGGENLAAPNVQVDATDTGKVSRTDGPLLAGIFLDKFLSDTFMLSFAHERGVGVAPLTSGISFTGVSFLWYLLGPAGAVSPTADSTLFVKRWAPYAGLSAGFAQASMTRSNDPVPTITGSGLYFGIKAGFDVPTAPGTGFKTEIVYNSTSFAQSFSSSATAPPVLIESGLQFAWYFDF